MMRPYESRSRAQAHARQQPHGHTGPVSYNGELLRKCPQCGQMWPLYRFRGRSDADICISCQDVSRRNRWRRSSPIHEFRKFDPPLTTDLKDKLDDYVRKIIDSGSYASLNANHRLLRDLGEERATDALFVYADTAREWCIVTHGKGNGRHYHFMGYRGEEEPEYRFINPSDFKLIDRYIASREKPLVLNTAAVDQAGIELSTPDAKRWLLLRSYFGLRPEHKVLWRGAVDGRAFWNRKFDTFLVGDVDDEVPPDAEGHEIAVKLFGELTDDARA